MRVLAVCAALAVAACADMTTSSPEMTDAVELTSFASVSEETPVVFNVTMRAENEPNGASTSESKGAAQLKVFADGTIEFLLTVNNKSGETFTRAHIHKAVAGSNGGIHWDLLEAGNPVASLSDQPSQLRGVARARTAAVLGDLLANPSGYYVNVHSTAFPGGAVRGQVQ